MMGGLLPSVSSALACLQRPGNCIITEDEVILQHKGGTGAENLIREGWEMLVEHVNTLPKLTPDRQLSLCLCSAYTRSYLLFCAHNIISSTGKASAKV